MDWIEQWLGLNPDGGDGSVEAIMIGGAVIVVVAVATSLHPAGRRLIQRLAQFVRSRQRESS